MDSPKTLPSPDGTPIRLRPDGCVRRQSKNYGFRDRDARTQRGKTRLLFRRSFYAFSTEVLTEVLDVAFGCLVGEYRFRAREQKWIQASRALAPVLIGSDRLPQPH